MSSMPWDSASGLGHHVDRLAFGQANVCLAPVVAAPLTEAEGLDLPLDVQDIHRLDLDVEQLLYRGLHIGLGCGCRDFEHVLVGCFLQPGRLFRHARGARSEEHTSDLQSLMLSWYARLCCN